MPKKLKNNKNMLNAINDLGKISSIGLEQVSSLKNIGSTTATAVDEKEEIINTTEQNYGEILEETKSNQEAVTINLNRSTDKYQELIQKSEKDIKVIDVSLLDNAPPQWNIFPKLSDTKLTYLKLSILNSGLFDPIIVWKKINGRYMILSGHNRVEAFRELLVEYPDNEYTHIKAIIYDTNEIDEEKAQEIIIDTNFIQRGEFSPKLRAKIIQARTNIYKKQTDKKGRRVDELAKDLGLKKTTIYEDFQIIERVIKPISEMYYEGIISRAAVLKVPLLDNAMQEMIVSEYPDKIDNKHLKAIKKDMSEREIRNIFEEETENIVGERRVHLRIPDDRYDEFMKLYYDFIKKE